jgi:predicted phage terminase large subunit-like protein
LAHPDNDRDELDQLILLEETKLLEADLYSFLEDGWAALQPNRPFKRNWHIDAVCDHAQAVTEGHIQNLVINIPPRHLKSHTISIFWPAWSWIHKSYWRWLFLSYGTNLVLRDAQQTRALINSDWYQQRWADKFQLVSDQNVKSFFLNDKGGARLTASFEADPTGEGGDVIVVDDPLRISDADNVPAIEKVNEVWDGTLATRLNDPKTGARVIIMQRLHENDLTGHVLKEKGWVHLYLPTVYETHRKCIVFLPKDLDAEGRPTPEAQPFFWDPRTYEGQLLHPERYDEAEVERLRRKGDWHFNSQQQQRPMNKGGTIFKEDWWQYYDVLPSEVDFYNDSCQSWDCSFKDKNSSSYVVCTVWARHGSKIYLVYRLRKRMQFPETLKAFKTISNDLFPWVGAKYIEDKANGTAVIQTLTDLIPGMIPVTPEGGKESRAHAVSYLVQAGNVYLPNPMKFPWVKDEYIPELSAFPKGEFDDQVDSTTQALYHHFHLRPPMEIPLSEILGTGEDAPMMTDQAHVF